LLFAALTGTARCTACHHAGNFDPAHVPGHPDWHLAPATMAWQGRSLAQICSQIKDRARNGGRNLAALIHHVSEDSLVGWAWAPGAGRGAHARTGNAGAVWRAHESVGRHRRLLSIAGKGSLRFSSRVAVHSPSCGPCRQDELKVAQGKKWT